MSDVGQYVGGRIRSLIESKNRPGTAARLARLRRGVGKFPGELPELWGEFLMEMPEKMLSRIGEPTWAEWAVYLTMTLFAVHQQGQEESVHMDGISLGSAAAQLIDNTLDQNAERQRVMHRFGPVVTAKSMPELAHHLRSMIKLFRAKGIKLDYSLLADHIYLFQISEKRREVQLLWAQDFTRNNKKGEDES